MLEVSKDPRLTAVDWGVHTMSVAVSQCSLLRQGEAWAEQCPMNQTVNDSIQATSASLPPPAQQGEAHCETAARSLWQRAAVWLLTHYYHSFLFRSIGFHG